MHVQEYRVPEQEIFNPVQPEGDNIGHSNGHNNKLQRFDGTPQTFEIPQGCWNGNQGKDQLINSINT
jgi:hypothetical protein